MNLKSLIVNFWKELLTGILVTFIVFVLLDSDSEIVRFIASAIVGVFVGFFIGLYKARRAVQALLKAAEIEDKVLSEFIYWVVERKVIGLLNKNWPHEWVALEQQDLKEFVRICFLQSQGKYIGTDRHVPSVFYSLYPEYLGSQKSRGTVEGDIRFVLYDQQLLKADFDRKESDGKTFVESHAQDGVRLLGVPYDVAHSEAERLRLPSTDLGLFGGQFVVFFSPPSGATKSGSIMVQSIDEKLTERLEGFLCQLARHASEVVMANGRPVFRERQREDKEADIRNVMRNQWK